MANTIPVAQRSTPLDIVKGPQALPQSVQVQNAAKQQEAQAKAQAQALQARQQAQAANAKPAPNSSQALTQAQQLQLRKAKIQNYQFTTTTQGLLKKYAQYPASLNFHIYENHYRFNNLQDSNIIPKSSPMIKSFLKHVIREEIPAEMSELLKDCSIKSYDGCLILQVYDHRNMISKEPQPDKNAKAGTTAGNGSSSTENGSGATSAKQGTVAAAGNGTAAGANSKAVTTTASAAASKPKTYRTVLKPTQLSLYYDLLYHTDSALMRFTDPLSLQMESEILTLTNRKLDLSVPLNPYLCDDYLKPEVEYPRKVYDKETDEYKLIHSHRPESHKPQRKLHQDEIVLHKSSEYEEIMFLLSNKYKKGEDIDRKLIAVEPSSSAVAAAAAAAAASVGSTNSGTGTPTASVGPSSSKDSKAGGTGTPSKEDKKKESSLAPNSALNGGKNGSGATSVVNNSLSGNTAATATGQFMRLRFIEEIRKRKESQKAQKEATVLPQTNAINGGNAAVNPVGNASAKPANQAENISQPGSNNAATGVVGGTIGGAGAGIQRQGGAGGPGAVAPNPNTPIGGPQNMRYRTGSGAGMNNGAKPGMPGGAGSPVAPAAAMNGNLQKQQQNMLAEKAQMIRAQQLQAQQQFQRSQQHQQPQQQQQQSQQQIRQPGQQQQGGQQAALRQQQLQQQQQSQTSQSQQQQLQAQAQALRQQQLQQQMQAQQQIKRQKVDPSIGQMPNSQPTSNMGTPVMRNGSMIPQQQQQQQQQQQSQQQISQSSGQPQSQGQSQGQGSGQRPGQTTAQIQQQQIFQSSLSAQEQQQFRSLQSRMSAFAMMGNSGVAPNGTQLTQQQQQQAVQQAKLIQQQLLQKFPLYFQRLRQFQIQQQRQRQQQQQGGGGAGGQSQSGGASQLTPQQQQQLQRQQMQQHLQRQQQQQSMMGNNNSNSSNNNGPQMNQYNQQAGGGVGNGGQFNQQGPNNANSIGGAGNLPGGLTQQQMMNQQMMQSMANMNQQKKRAYQKKKT